jgi:chaperonin cofactor prefoldin
VAKSELTTKCAEQEDVCELLKQEKDSLQQHNHDLLHKLQEVQEEHSCLKTVYGTVTQQLSQLHKCQSEVDAIKEHAAVISEVMTAKTAEAMDLKEEKDSLQKMLDEIAGELDHRKAQVLL